jgi:dihydrofolate reductase
MIRFIVAVDSKLGMANEHGIPWQGKLPSDIKQFREHTVHSTVLMGYATYMEFDHPLSDRKNYVASTKQETLRPGFALVNDAFAFLKAATEDIWVIGGAGLFTATLEVADELLVTQLVGDFNCTKFFPPFQDKFELKSSSEQFVENNIPFVFQVWTRKPIV